MNVPVSVIIPTWRRTDRAIETLGHILDCRPPPAEILVHVDAGDPNTEIAIARCFPAVRLITADTPQGPGGARNRLVAEARHEFIVSLDDDSYPMDSDFFVAAIAEFEKHPEAGVLAMAIAHNGEEIAARRPTARLVADFVGCGCAYRRSAFLETDGYLPLLLAYGLEEADLALQLLDLGFTIVHVDNLRIRHATDRSHQCAAHVVAAHVKNTLLLMALRYPFRWFPLGFMQWGNRVVYSLRRGWVLGALLGIAGTPYHLIRYAHHRAAVGTMTIEHARRLRRNTTSPHPLPLPIT